MKKILLATLMLASVSTFAFSSSVTSAPAKKIASVTKANPIDAVPKAVQQTFNSMFKTAINVQWTVVSTPAGAIFVADFYLAENPTTVKHIQAGFTADGKFIGKRVVLPSTGMSGF